MTREIGAFEAKNRLSELLEEVAAGGEVVITKRGRPVARLVPATGAPDRRRAEAALERIFERSRKLTLDGISIRELIDEGRP